MTLAALGTLACSTIKPEGKKNFAPVVDNVATVRNGLLPAGVLLLVPYNTTTVGKAFEGTFLDSKWESKETAKGAHFVEFTGRLKPEMYKEWADGCSHLKEKFPELKPCPTEEEYSTVKFQFMFVADGSFSLSYIDLAPWRFTKLVSSAVASVDPNDVLAYIYQ